MQTEIQTAIAAIPRADLRKAMALVKKTAERRNTIPVLSNMLVEGYGDGLRIKATDLDIELTCDFPGVVCPVGFATTIPVHHFADLERKAAKGEFLMLESAVIPPEQEPVTEDTPDDECARRGALTALRGRAAVYSPRVTIGAASAKLQAIAASDFPSLEIKEPIKAFQVPRADLLAMIEATQFAISTEETRYYLNGIFLHAVENAGKPMLRAIATDGHRMAWRAVPCPAGAEAIPGVIIPRKSVTLLRDLLKAKNAPDAVSVRVNTTKADFIVGAVTIRTKLIDGTFPDYVRVVPRSNPLCITFDPVELSSTIKSVLAIATDKSRAVKLSFAGKTGGQCTVSVQNPDAGDAQAFVAFEAFDQGGIGADGFEIGFNGRYMLDILASLPACEPVTIAMADAGSPMLIQSGTMHGTPGDDMRVQMPMRI